MGDCHTHTHFALIVKYRGKQKSLELNKKDALLRITAIDAI